MEFSFRIRSFFLMAALTFSFYVLEKIFYRLVNKQGAFQWIPVFYFEDIKISTYGSFHYFYEKNNDLWFILQFLRE